MRTHLLFLSTLILLSVGSLNSEVLQSTNSYLSAADKARLKSILEPGFKLEDVSALHYAVQGYKLLKEAIPNPAVLCEYLNKFLGNKNDLTLENIFHVATTWNTIGTCKAFPMDKVSQALTDVIEKDTSTISELYHAVHALLAVSQKLTNEQMEKVTKTLQAVLKKDDSLLNLAYAFHIASYVKPAQTFVFDRIEDAIIQADEVDGQYLQFEGGLSITSFVINGVYKLSSTMGKKPPLTSQQVVKMANYLLSRRSVQIAKGVTGLLSALTVLATNEFETPICITLAETGIVVSAQQPFVTVKVCDIFGEPLPSVPKVVANSATRVGDDVVVLSKESLRPSTSDKTWFTMNFMDVKPDRGFYKISVTAEAATNTVTVKVLSEVTVDYLEIGTGDADQTTQPKLTRVSFPGKLDHKIEADSQQKLVLRFLLRDSASKKAIRVHQAFVRLSSVSDSSAAADKRSREIIFVAEPDAAHVYKFDMPVGSAAVNFDYLSGEYNVELIVGDALLSNSFQWTVATVTLKFPESSGSYADKKLSHDQNSNIYSTKPEIRHMFREPEKRPPAFVSNLFTGLCLSPILLLIILWAKLGVNISNFPLSISAIMFHLGLGSIFVLFGIFWLKLNMFVTLRYLLGLGVVTFLAGNKLLSHIAHRHKLSQHR